MCAKFGTGFYLNPAPKDPINFHNVLPIHTWKATYVCFFYFPLGSRPRPIRMQSFQDSNASRSTLKF